MDEKRTFEFELTIDELHLLGETIEEAHLDALKQLESGVLVPDDIEYFREKERVLQAILAATPEWNTRPCLTDARLAEALAWFAPTDAWPSANDQFEAIAAMFQKDTGYLRPGKSYAGEDYEPEDRDLVWENWKTAKREEMREIASQALGEVV